MRSIFSKTQDQHDKNPWELLSEAKHGDQEAFGHIYKLFVQPVYKYVYMRVRNQEEAEDITQITFIKVFENIHTLENKKDTPLNFLFTVARNTIIDHGRKKKSVTLEEEEWITIADHGESTDAHAVREEKKRHLEHALLLVHETDREILELKAIQELDTKEIAQILGKTEVAVRKAYSRALAHLKEVLENNGYTT